MNSQQQEHHVLVINDGKGKHAIALDAAAYSIGRDSTNAIVLDFETVSRQHAIVLRVPVPGTNSYKYRLVDGNSEGQRSTNGVYINGQRCTTHELMHGDVIGFGRKIKASYLALAMGESEFLNYLESIEFQSIKSKQVNPKATLVGLELNTGELSGIRARELVSMGAHVPQTHAQTVVAVEKVAIEKQTDPGPSSASLRNSVSVETIHEPMKPTAGKWMTIAGVAAAIAVVAAGAFYFAASQQTQAPPRTPTSQHSAAL